MAKKLKKKRKIKWVSIFITFLLLGGISLVCYLVMIARINNIIILGNNQVSDQEVIDLAEISDYPEFYLLNTNSIKRKLLANPYIKDVSIKKDFYHVLEITITEYLVLYQRSVDEKIILEDGSELLSDEKVLGIPILLNYVPDTKQESFLNGMKNIKRDILKQISEITYVPNEYDKDRFLLMMDDGNSVYLTLTKFEMINYYDEVLPQLEGRKGILYLDSGNHFQIME